MDGIFDKLDLIEEAASEGYIQFWGKAERHLLHQKIKKDFWEAGKKINRTTFLFRDEGVATQHDPKGTPHTWGFADGLRRLPD